MPKLRMGGNLSFKGRKHSKESITKISQSLINKTGEKSRRWKGDDAGYVAKHMWITKHHGKAAYCEADKSHIAKRYEWANISGKYKREREDYKQLCPSCHRRLDHGNFCRKGHEYTIENTYIRKEGWRVCKACQKIAQSKHNAKNN